MATSETTEHAALVRRVKAAMTAVPPEDLSTDELTLILNVIEGAIDRPHPEDLIGNVVRLASWRRHAEARYGR